MTGRDYWTYRRGELVSLGKSRRTMLKSAADAERKSLASYIRHGRTSICPRHGVKHGRNAARACPTSQSFGISHFALLTTRRSEYMLWTDDLSRRLVETYYPTYLHMFDSYKYPIQRADAIRYFVLHHFGGIYMDLDIGCRRRLDSLLQGDWEVLLPITKPVSGVGGVGVNRH